MVDLFQTCLSHKVDLNPTLEKLPVSNPNIREKEVDDIPGTWKSIENEQREDSDIAPLFTEALSEEELDKVSSGYYVKNEILMRKWKLSHTSALEDWSMVHQLVLPRKHN